MATPRITPISPDAPLLEKLMTYTPVVLTVVATLLAGLSSSEMTAAQYFRSSAAQAQSKAGDQWSLFQTKRSRAINMNTTQDLLWGLGETPSADPAETAATLQDLTNQLKKVQQLATRIGVPAAALVEDLRAADRAVAALQTALHPATSMPSATAPAATPVEPLLQATLQAISDRAPEEEIRARAAQVDAAAFSQAVTQGENAVQAAEQATAPLRKELNAANRTLEQSLTSVRLSVRRARDVSALLLDGTTPATAGERELSDQLALASTRLQTAAEAVGRGFLWSKLRTNAAIYDREALSNLSLAQLYEVAVRRADAASERHRTRAQRFFMGMLAAQAGVLIASFSLAVRKRSILWSLASTAGIAAILFGAYVYLYV